MVRVPTTDEVDKITSEERNALVGYCENHDEWFEFTRNVHIERCPKCKALFSTISNFQVITQRSFNRQKSKSKKPKRR